MRKECIVITSDISDVDGADTVHFAIDGTDYEIDLTRSESNGLRAMLGPYMAAGRKTAAPPKTVRSPVAKRAKPQPSAARVREWARAQGVEIPDRGRIPRKVLDAYEGRIPVGDVAPGAAEPAISRTPTVPLAPQFRNVL